jgi:L-fuconolactonase
VTIDAHQHFWKYDPVEYDWINDKMSVIRRDFQPADLAREIGGAQISSVISVQARQTVEETRWLLQLARAYDFIAGVVGWLPLASSRIEYDLAEYAPNQKLRGVRHVLQGEPDEYMARADFNNGISLLARHGLTYDILIVERQLAAAIALVERHPKQTFILDHAAKPRIGDRLLSPWRQNMRELARRPNVVCKISGLVTEADYRGWSNDQIRTYVEVLLETFTPNRLMFGSDWPVCLVACGYQRWATLVRSFIVGLSRGEQSEIMGNTAKRAYGIK